MDLCSAVFACHWAVSKLEIVAMAGADFQFIQLVHGLAVDTDIFKDHVFHTVLSVPPADK